MAGAQPADIHGHWARKPGFTKPVAPFSTYLSISALNVSKSCRLAVFNSMCSRIGPEHRAKTVAHLILSLKRSPALAS